MLGLGERPDSQQLGESIERHWNEARSAADGRSAAGHLKQAYRNLRKDTAVAFKAIPKRGTRPSTGRVRPPGQDAKSNWVPRC